MTKWMLKKNQTTVFRNTQRFLVLVCGRRWAKTTTALLKIFSQACQKQGLYGYFAPTYKQGKLIAWTILKEIVPKNYLVKSPNESDLFITLKNGSIIRIFGVDKAENLRGVKLAGGVGDEYDQWKDDVYEKILRPALSDSQGWFWFIGSPDSTKRRLREKYEQVLLSQNEGTNDEWAAYKFKSIEGGYIPAEEIEKAKKELDERTYREEYEASFEDLIGQVYYSFSLKGNVVSKDPFGTDVEYNPRLPLRMYWDFNVNPFCVSLGHHLPRVNGDGTNYVDAHVFGEMVIKNSNTPEMCRQLLEKYGNHRAGIIIYGDASGSSRHTNAAFSDYQIIIDNFKNAPGFKLKIKRANPKVKDRINAVNSKLCSHDGRRHLFIHPRAKKLTQDFMSVTYKEGTTELDKRDLELTHLTDGLGYGIDYEFPVVKGYVR